VRVQLDTTIINGREPNRKLRGRLRRLPAAPYRQCTRHIDITKTPNPVPFCVML
jgi:hypothetical protein